MSPQNPATPHTSTPASRRRRIRNAALASVIVAGVLFGGAAPASAETDRLSDQCIYVAGAQRACAYYMSVSWGSGLYWRAGGQVVDTRADSWYNVIEVKLNRRVSSNTHWIQVARAYDWQSAYQPESGYDPTYGAWMRLCTVSLSGTKYFSGTKYCNASEYVQDNS